VAKPARQIVTDTCEVDFADARRVKRVERVMKSTEAVTALAETFKLQTRDSCCER
jgi:hypothetical protein